MTRSRYYGYTPAVSNIYVDYEGFQYRIGNLDDIEDFLYMFQKDVIMKIKWLGTVKICNIKKFHHYNKYGEFCNEVVLYCNRMEVPV